MVHWGIEQFQAYIGLRVGLVRPDAKRVVFQDKARYARNMRVSNIDKIWNTFHAILRV